MNLLEGDGTDPLHAFSEIVNCFTWGFDRLNYGASFSIEPWVMIITVHFKRLILRLLQVLHKRRIDFFVCHALYHLWCLRLKQASARLEMVGLLPERQLSRLPGHLLT